MDIEKIAAYLQNPNPVTIRSDLCSRTITPRSSCLNCTKICPSQSITLTSNGPKVEQCISCGLCIDACPNHVFILNEMKLLEKKTNENQTLIITCNLIFEKTGKNFQSPVTKIGCLGELYPELTLFLLSSFSQIILIQDPNQCNSCLGQNPKIKLQLEQYQDIFEKSLIDKLLVIEDINKIKKLHNNQKQESVPNRRSFFKSIFTGSKNISRQILDSALPQEKPKSKVKPLKTKYFYEALKRQSRLDYAKLLPFPVLQLSACNFCGVCSKLCPTGAIKINAEQKEKKITFIPNLCTHCNICCDVCYYQGLTWGENITIGDFLNVTTPVILGSAYEKICSNCDQEYYDLDEKQELCFLCRPLHDINL